MKIIAAVLLALVLAGCQTGYFRLNQNEAAPYWSAVAKTAGQTINHR